MLTHNDKKDGVTGRENCTSSVIASQFARVLVADAMARHRDVQNATIAIFWRRNLDSTVRMPEQFNLKLPEGNSVAG
jgi:hypothetical protein